MSWPDWKKEKEYEYIKNLGPQGFAWEFLRRTKGYQDNYEDLLKLQSLHGKEWGKCEENKFYPRLSLDRPLKTISETRNRFIDKSSDFFFPNEIDTSDHNAIRKIKLIKSKFEVETYDQYYGRVAWGLKNGLIDPQLNFNEINQEDLFFTYQEFPKHIRRLPDIDEFFVPEIENNLENDFINEEYAIFSIDLRKALKAQLDALKLKAKELQKQLKASKTEAKDISSNDGIKLVPKYSSKSFYRNQHGNTGSQILNHLRFIDTDDGNNDVAAIKEKMDTLKLDYSGEDDDTVNIYKYRLQDVKKILRNWKRYLVAK